MTSSERINFIEEKLRQTFTVQSLEIIDDSHLHVAHRSHGGAGHFTVNLVSDDFVNVRRVQRHQMIYNALNELMGTEIHALAINAKTIDEG